MTYSALSTLLILGDDFARVDRAGIVAMLRGLQQPTGSYGPWTATAALVTLARPHVLAPLGPLAPLAPFGGA